MTATTIARPAPQTTGPVAYCPNHTKSRLQGGPVQFWCTEGEGHRVQAADIDKEVTR